MKIHKRDTNQKVIIQFHRRGWFGKDKDVCKLEGEVCLETEVKKKKKHEALMLITGNWNSDILLTRVKPHKGEAEVVWSKSIYP